MYKQTAVYWGNPVNDGYGKNTYDSPVEISCRWENVDQVVEENNVDGRKLVSRSVVYTDSDLDVEGVLFLGCLSDLTSEEKSDPSKKESAFIIKRVEKSPAIGSDDTYIIKAHLTPFITWE